MFKDNVFHKLSCLPLISEQFRPQICEIPRGAAPLTSDRMNLNQTNQSTDRTRQRIQVHPWFLRFGTTFCNIHVSSLVDARRNSKLTCEMSTRFSYLIGSVWSFRSFCSSGGIPFHLKNKSQPNPPRWSAFDDPWYANVSAFITSIAGHTTLERASAILAISGSTQPGVASQCESRNVRTSPVAAWAPFNRARTSPSRLVFLITETLLIVATWSSSGLPSLSVMKG